MCAIANKNQSKFVLGLKQPFIQITLVPFSLILNRSITAQRKLMFLDPRHHQHLLRYFVFAVEQAGIGGHFLG